MLPQPFSAWSVAVAPTPINGAPHWAVSEEEVNRSSPVPQAAYEQAGYEQVLAPTGSMLINKVTCLPGESYNQNAKLQSRFFVDRSEEEQKWEENGLEVQVP